MRSGLAVEWVPRHSKYCTKLQIILTYDHFQIFNVSIIFHIQIMGSINGFSIPCGWRMAHVRIQEKDMHLRSRSAAASRAHGYPYA